MMTEETPLIPMDGRRVGRAIVAYFHVLFMYSSRRFPTPMSVMADCFPRFLIVAHDNAFA